MVLIAEFHPEASAEFDAALEYYELVRLGLGAAFLAEVKAATSTRPSATHCVAHSFDGFPIMCCTPPRRRGSSFSPLLTFVAVQAIGVRAAEHKA